MTNLMKYVYSNKIIIIKKKTSGVKRSKTQALCHTHIHAYQGHNEGKAISGLDHIHVFNPPLSSLFLFKMRYFNSEGWFPATCNYGKKKGVVHAPDAGAVTRSSTCAWASTQSVCERSLGNAWARLDQFESGRKSIITKHHFSKEILKEVHAGLCGAHQAGPKLYNQIKMLGYYWRAMVADAM